MNGRNDTRPTKQQRMLRATVALGAVTLLTTGVIPAANAADLTSIAPTGQASLTQAAFDEVAINAAIVALKTDYFHNVDTKNWAALRNLLSPNVIVDTTRAFGPYFQNRASFVAFTALTLGAVNTHHVGSDPHITVSSDTTASAQWQLRDRLVIANLIGMQGYGYYHDRYEKVGGQWVEVYSKLTRDRIDIVLPFLSSILPDLATIQVYNAHDALAPMRALAHAIYTALRRILGIPAEPQPAAGALPAPATAPAPSVNERTDPAPSSQHSAPVTTHAQDTTAAEPPSQARSASGAGDQLQHPTPPSTQDTAVTTPDNRSAPDYAVSPASDDGAAQQDSPAEPTDSIGPNSPGERTEKAAKPAKPAHISPTRPDRVAPLKARSGSRSSAAVTEREESASTTPATADQTQNAKATDSTGD